MSVCRTQDRLTLCLLGFSCDSSSSLTLLPLWDAWKRHRYPEFLGATYIRKTEEQELQESGGAAHRTLKTTSDRPHGFQTRLARGPLAPCVLLIVGFSI